MNSVSAKTVTAQVDASYIYHLLLLFQLQELSVSIIVTHTHPFNSPVSGTTWVSQYQKGKTNLDITEARDSEWR